MAATTRAITPTNTGIFAPNTVAPDTPTSISSNPQAAAVQSAKGSPHARLTPIIANTTLRGSESPKSPRTVLSPALTGAAAMAEQRLLREKQQRDAARQTSPNPGTTAIQTLLDRGMSTSKDAPAAVTKMSDPLAKVARNIEIPDKTSNDPNQTSPISMSSFGSLDTTTAPTATAMEPTAGPPTLDNAPPSDGTTPKPTTQEGKATPSQNESGTRAYTFPPPLDQDPRSTPQRGMSLPMPYSHQHGQQATPQTRSPSISTGSGSSTKRHKCPYCSTDFTRHHNLKSHLLTHSQEKPYECPTCNARFRRLHDLKRHTKLHTGERPHTCPKCGRRFARGDALARHGKGVGGCAGRRSSFGAPGSAGDDDGEGMDGLEYSEQQTAEPERMDEDDDMEGDRRRSEPSREVQHPGGASASTYPPIQGAGASRLGNSVRAMYPPPQTSTNTTNTTSSSVMDHGSPNIAPRQSGASTAPGGMPFPPQQPSVFGQPGMTESPKPLSPGQEGQRGSISEASLQGGRSLPGYTRSRGSSSVSLHPNANPPQLPSLPGLNPTHAPSMLHQSMPAPGPPSNPGSHSSHGQSSGGSMREVLSGGPNQGGPDVWAVVRDLEGRMARMVDDHSREIMRLSDEVSLLKAQLREALGGPGREAPQHQTR